MHRALHAVMLVAALSFPCLAAEIQLSPGQDTWSLDLLGSDLNSTRLQFDLNRFRTDEVDIEGETWTTLALGDLALHHDRGAPALPTLRRSIVIPDDAAMGLRVLDARYREFEGMSIAPSKGTILRNTDPAMVSYVFGESYGRDDWFPGEIATLDAPYIMRDLRGQVVELNPFQYNPATGVLRVYTSITVEVARMGSGAENVLTSRPEKLDAEFAKIYADHFLNFEAAGDRYVSVPEVGSMLVITYDAFHASMQPFVDWKNQMGVPTEIVDVSSVGSTGAQIKSYIQSYYDAHGVAFVLLVGDGAQIPLPSGGSDPIYSLTAGGDSYPDIFVGRFSAENTGQVETQVLRSVEYERDVALGQAWMQYGMGVASNQGPGDDGEYDNEHEDVIRSSTTRATAAPRAGAAPASPTRT